MSEIYVSLEEAAGLEGVAYTAMLNRIDRSFGSIRVKRVNQAKGGRPFTLVCLDSLSSKAQRAYRKAHEPQAEAPEDELPWYLQVDLNWYIERNKVAYYRAVEAAKRIEKFAGYDLYGDKAEYAEELAQIMGISQRSLYRMTDAWLEAHAWAVHLTQQTGESYEHLTALALCRKPRMAGAFPSIPAEHKALIENIWFDRSFAQNNCSIELLYERYTALGKEKGWTSFPSTKTVGRYITYLMETRRAKSAHYLAARGEREWKNQKMLKAKRDTHSLLAMEYVQGDEHTFDCWVAARINGRLRAVRPKLVAWIDVRTRCIMGSVICVDANTQTIKQSLTKMIYSERGGVPHHLHIDNGKDYTSRANTGQKRTERQMLWDEDSAEVQGFYRAIGIELWSRSLPYQPWDKGQIERAFGTVCRLYTRRLDSYTGTLTGSKTIGKVRKDVDGMLERGELLTLEEFAADFEGWLENEYSQREHRGLKDAGEKWTTPASCWDNAERWEKALPPREYVAMLLMPSDTALVTNQGITRWGTLFAHEELGRLIGQKVTIRWDADDVRCLYVYDKDGRKVCEAQAAELLGFGERVSQTALEAHMRRQKRQLKEAREELEQYRTPYEQRLNPEEGEKPVAGTIDLMKKGKHGARVVALPQDKTYRETQKEKRQKKSDAPAGKYLTDTGRSVIESWGKMG